MPPSGGRQTLTELGARDQPEGLDRTRPCADAKFARRNGTGTRRE
jgi:hypothetical protein